MYMGDSIGSAFIIMCILGIQAKAPAYIYYLKENTPFEQTCIRELDDGYVYILSFRRCRKYNHGTVDCCADLGRCYLAGRWYNHLMHVRVTSE